MRELEESIVLWNWRLGMDYVRRLVENCLWLKIHLTESRCPGHVYCRWQAGSKGGSTPLANIYDCTYGASICSSPKTPTT
jgi:hypothetical protein